MRHQYRDLRICRFRRLLPNVSLSMAIFGAAVSIGLGTTLQAGSAATEVQGHVNELQIRADNASVKEVFDALSVQLKLTYNLPANVGGNLTGLYSGSLKQVLSSVLAGNDFVIATSDDGVRVVVLNASSAINSAPTLRAGAANGTPVAQPATASTRTPSPSKPIPPLSSYLQ